MNAVLVAVYVAAMVTANLLVWWLGPGFSPINSFLLIGLDLTLRDVMHERFTRWQLAGVICVGAVLTWVLNPSAAHIAIASASAFGLAAIADWLTYERLRSQPVAGGPTVQTWSGRRSIVWCSRRSPLAFYCRTSSPCNSRPRSAVGRSGR